MSDVINDLLFLKEKLYNGIFKDRIGCIDVAINACKKQDLRDVIKSECNNDCEKDCIDCNKYTDRCPTCGDSLSNEYKYCPKYCPECGQKLSW